MAEISPLLLPAGDHLGHLQLVGVLVRSVDILTCTGLKVRGRSSCSEMHDTSIFTVHSSTEFGSNRNRPRHDGPLPQPSGLHSLQLARKKPGSSDRSA